MRKRELNREQDEKDRQVLKWLIGKRREGDGGRGGEIPPGPEVSQS